MERTDTQICEKRDEVTFTGDFGKGFELGKNRVLEEALTLPKSTDFWMHFDGDKVSDLFWYFRAPRGEYGKEIERKYKTEINENYTQIDAGANSMVLWGERSGEIAAIRWLVDDVGEWPDLDS